MTNEYQNFRTLQNFGNKAKNLGIVLVIFNILLFIVNQIIVLTAFSSKNYYNYNSGIENVQSMLSNLQLISILYFVIIKIYTILFLMDLKKADLKFGRKTDNIPKIIALYSAGIVIEAIVILAGFIKIDAYLLQNSNSYFYTSGQNVYSILNEFKKMFLLLNFIALISIILRMIAYDMLAEDFNYLPLYGQRQNIKVKQDVINGTKNAKKGEFPVLIARMFFILVSDNILAEFIAIIGGLIIVGGLINLGNAFKLYVYSPNDIEKPLESRYSKNTQVIQNQYYSTPMNATYTTTSLIQPTAYIAPQKKYDTYIEDTHKVNFCAHCGSKIQDYRDLFCSQCGYKH